MANKLSIPYFTVILAVRNGASTLEKAIGSVITQTFHNWELLIVVNDSTDASLSIAQSYATLLPTIRVITTDVRGLANARNLGMEKATGEYLTFLDADDYFFPDMLRTFAEALQQQPCDVMITSLHKSNELTTHRIFPLQPHAAFMALLDPFTYRKNLGADIAALPDTFRMLVAPWARVYRRSFLEETALRFDVRCYVQEDFIFNMAVYSMAREVRILDCLLYCIVPSFGSNGCRNTAEFMQENADAIAVLLESDSPNQPEEVRQAVRFHAVFIIYHMLLLALQPGRRNPSGLAFLENYIQREEIRNLLLHVRPGTIWGRRSVDPWCQAALPALQTGDLQTAIALFNKMCIQGDAELTGEDKVEEEEVVKDDSISVSIILPVYNVAPYLEECLLSLLAQKYQPLEILLIDDGSTDQSGTICDNYATRYEHIHTFHQPQNMGQSAARNEGVRRAQGSHIIFVDADDTVTPDYVSYLIQLRLRFNADIALAMPQQHFLTRSFATILTRKEAVYAIFRYRRYYPINILIPREVALQTPFPVGRVCEDLLIVPQLMAAVHKVAFSTKVTYFYRMREGSTMHSYSYKKTSDLISAFTEVVDFVHQDTPQAWPMARQRLLEKLVEEYETLRKNAPQLLQEVLPLLQRTARIYTVENRHTLELSAHDQNILSTILTTDSHGKEEHK